MYARLIFAALATGEKILTAKISQSMVHKYSLQTATGKSVRNAAMGKIWSKTKTNLLQVVLCIQRSNKHAYMKTRTQACFSLHG